jgi:UDP-glucose 4-epimerase
VGEVFNIGNTREITMNALAERIRQMTGSLSEIVHIPYDRAYEQGFEDMPRRVPDISKIQRLTGYQPTVQLDEILARVIADFRHSEERELAAAEKTA